MNEKAVEAIKKQIKKWLVNIALPSKEDLGEGWSAPSAQLESEILKVKSTWLTSKSVCTLVIDALEEVCPDFLDRKGGRLTDRIIINDAVDIILEKIIRVPYRYKAFFQFDMSGSNKKFSFQLEKGVELTTYNLVDVMGENNLGLLEQATRRSVFFSVEIEGFIPEKNNGRNGISTTAAEQDAHGAVKVFLERGLAASVLRFKERVEMWVQSSNLRGLMHVHRYGVGAEVERKFSTVLPQDFASIIKRITYGYVSGSDANGYRNLLESYLKICVNENETSRAIRAASEWRLDSLSDSSDAMRLVKVCIGLESLFGDQDNDSGLTKSLSDRCAYSLAQTHDERISINERCRQLYQSRSKIVHGVTNRLDDRGSDLLQFGDKVLSRAISRESLLLPGVGNDGIRFMT